MDCQDLVFSGNQQSNVNEAIASLIAQLYTVKDSGIPGSGGRAPLQMWNFVGRGIGLPDYGDDVQTIVTNVSEEQSPAILIYDNRDRHISETTVWIDNTVRTHVSLFCYIYALGSNAGSYPDIQEIRRNMTKATLRALRPVSDDNLTGWSGTDFPYWPEEPQIMEVDYDDDLRNKFPDFAIVPPWWCWRIDLALMAWNVN